jgi:hypothetical protein
MTHSNRDFIGSLITLVGIYLLLFGLNAPVLSEPFTGSRSLVDRWWVAWLIGFVVTVTFSGWLGSTIQDIVLRVLGSRIVGVVSFLVLLVTFFIYQNRVTDVTGALSRVLPDPNTDLESAILNSMGLKWGWVLLFSGALVVAVAGSGRPSARTSAVVLLLVLSVGVGVSWAQIGSVPPLDISVVHVNNSPISGATVVIQRIDTKLVDIKLSSSAGNVSSVNLTPGRYEVKVRADGFQPVSRDINVGGGGGGGSGGSGGAESNSETSEPLKFQLQPESPPPFVPPGPQYPIVACPTESGSENDCTWLRAAQAIEQMDQSIEDLSTSKEITAASVKLLSGEETILVAEDAATEWLRENLVKAERKLVEVAFQRIHQSLMQLVAGSKLPNGWGPPTEGFRWDSPAVVAQKARAVVDDDRWVRHEAEQARKEVQSHRLVERVQVEPEHRPALKIKSCGQLSSCGQLMHVSIHGFTNM